MASFNGSTGAHPYDALISDGSGNLYGTTAAGGAVHEGTVFEVAAATGTITTLASFNGTNGATPYGGLFMDSSGNLYGTTYGFEPDRPASTYYGTVFEIAKGSGTITTLASFNGTDGSNPEAALVMDSSGNLYGTTKSGSVFEVVHGSGTITTLVTLSAPSYAGLVIDGSGNLYGTTYLGGASHEGSIFEVTKGGRSGHTLTTLASFNGTNGADPYAGLIMDSSGNLYGTTAYGGGSSDGTVFEVAAATSTVTTLVTFSGSNGANPFGGLLMDSSGNLYGTTFNGGPYGQGTVFELAGAAAPPALRISGSPSSRSGGASQTFTVTLQDAGGTTGAGFTGTVNFTSTDQTANLLANDMALDNGALTVTGFVLQKKGKPSITAMPFSAITGSLNWDIS